MFIRLFTVTYRGERTLHARFSLHGYGTLQRGYNRGYNPSNSATAELIIRRRPLIITDSIEEFEFSYEPTERDALAYVGARLIAFDTVQPLEVTSSQLSELQSYPPSFMKFVLSMLQSATPEEIVGLLRDIQESGAIAMCTFLGILGNCRERTISTIEREIEYNSRDVFIGPSF